MGNKPVYHLASFSGGKDSTAMVLRMIERSDKIDEVLYCDTTMEFPAMERHIEKVKRIIEDAGIKFTTLRAKHDFEYLFMQYQPQKKDPALAEKQGKSWPTPFVRWCTSDLKIDVLNKYINALKRSYSVTQYVGIAADEQQRLLRKQQQNGDKIFPLVEWGWTEADALAYCYKKGYNWEGLYETFDRVSCWCCPLKSLAELRKLRAHFPELWQRLAHLDSQTWRDFRPDGWSVERLEKRFAFEEALAAEGYDLKGKRFYTDLKRHCFAGVDLETILQERQEVKA